MAMAVGVLCDGICDHNDEEPDHEHEVFQHSELLVFSCSTELCFRDLGGSNIKEGSS